jgi:hypothetical protein
MAKLVAQVVVAQLIHGNLAEQVPLAKAVMVEDLLGSIAIHGAKTVVIHTGKQVVVVVQADHQSIHQWLIILREVMRALLLMTQVKVVQVLQVISPARLCIMVVVVVVVLIAVRSDLTFGRQ